MCNNYEYETVTKCPWCGSASISAWGKPVRDFTSAKCCSCNLIFIVNRFTEDSLVHFYKDYYSDIHQADKLLNIQRDSMYELEFELVGRHIKSGNVLDVGCSGGNFLDLFAENDYKCYGVEYGETAAEQAGKKYKIWYGKLPEIEFDRIFDLIIFRGVIEHVLDPKEYLKKADSLLTAGGLIYITSTPNSNSLCCELFKEKWNQHIPEEHLLHFSTELFDAYFSENGYKKVEEFYFYEKTPYADVENDVLKVSEAIQLKKDGKKIPFSSPAFWGTMMSLIYRKNK